MSTEPEAQEILSQPSDVLRPGSLPKREVDPTPFLLSLDGCPRPVSWSALFGNKNPVELEIGSGKGLFLANAATAHPDRNFLGIENVKKYAKQAAVRVAKRNLVNVKVLPNDALAFVAQYVPAASLRAVHVYFPDPWWKKRHKKRRVFAEPLILDVERTLIPGGELRAVTDVEEYFGVICELMSSHPRFVEQEAEAPRPPEHELDYLTNFERKYRIEGRPIYRRNYVFRGLEAGGNGE